MRHESMAARLTKDEYLKLEEDSNVRHEYVGGYIFAMSGATEAHNVISGNIFSFLHGRLKGSPCRAFINDMKVHVEEADSFYYPDIMVTCEPYEGKSVFKASPVLIFEVLSPSTTQIDRREKLFAYQKIASLIEYVIVHQRKKCLEIFSKQGEEWAYSVVSVEDALTLNSLPCGQLQLPMATIYDGAEPAAERVKEEESFYTFVDCVTCAEHY
jgi:Uma2 family endonuclease